MAFEKGTMDEVGIGKTIKNLIRECSLYIQFRWPLRNLRIYRFVLGGCKGLKWAYLVSAIRHLAEPQLSKPFQNL